MDRGRGTPSGHGLVAAALVALSLGATTVAALLAVARLRAPVTQRGIELVAFTPYGLPAALVGLAGTLALLWTRRNRRRTTSAAASTAGAASAFGLAVLHACWLGPQFVGAVPDADPAGTRLVVMTQNFEEGDAVEVSALVQRHAVDVLVLTDASEEQVADVIATGVGATLPHTTLGHGRGSVVWSRFPIASDTHISEGGDSRVVTLDVPGLGGVTVVAVHPKPPHEADGSWWQADWEQVMDLLGESYGDRVDGRVLLAGDLNATADHWPVRSLAAMGLRDVAEQLNEGPATTWPANGTQTRFGVNVPTLLALDHVMTASGLVATDQAVTGAVGSDHRGVIATLAPAAR